MANNVQSFGLLGSQSPGEIPMLPRQSHCFSNVFKSILEYKVTALTYFSFYLGEYREDVSEFRVRVRVLVNPVQLIILDILRFPSEKSFYFPKPMFPEFVTF